MNADRVIRDWKMFKGQLEAVGVSARSQSIADRLFSPNENLEILISNLIEIDGEADFASFVTAHGTVVAYLAEVDSYVQGSSCFVPQDLSRIEEHFTVLTDCERLSGQLQVARHRQSALQSLREFLSRFLPHINHALFDDIDCPEDVYQFGKSLTSDLSARSKAKAEADTLLPANTDDATDVQRQAGQWLAAIQAPLTTDSMERGVRRYLTLTAISILADMELKQSNERCRVLQIELDDARRLTDEEHQELTAFRRNAHAVYCTGRYAAHTQIVAPMILAKLAHEFKAAGGTVSFNVSMK